MRRRLLVGLAILVLPGAGFVAGLWYAVRKIAGK